MTTPGFSIPIHNSLTQPILLGGVPRRLAILNGTLFAAVTLGLQSPYAIPICAAIHITARILAKKDPYFFQVMLRHLKQKTRYEA